MDVNKLFAKIGNKTVLERTLLAFDVHENVQEIVLVVGRVNFHEISSFVNNLNFKKEIKVALGGGSRQESVRLGLEEVSMEYVLIHDGARPFINCDIIDNCISVLNNFDACCVGVPITDTIKRISNDTFTGTVDRSNLFAAQTPQGFKTFFIKNAHEKAFNDGFVATDDASLIEWLGKPVKVITGNYKNIKITHKEDILLAKAFMNENNITIRTGIGYDVHKFSKVAFERNLILGGVKIPYEFGLEGHSDADVLVHAVMDAILGATALGDIGLYFPPTDNAFKDISSLVLLKKVKDIVFNAGFNIINIDSVIMAESPKLLSHVNEMRQNIAEILETNIDNVGIKATTTENLGFVGRREGIAAQCNCLVQKIKM